MSIQISNFIKKMTQSQNFENLVQMVRFDVKYSLSKWFEVFDEKSWSIEKIQDHGLGWVIKDVGPKA